MPANPHRDAEVFLPRHRSPNSACRCPAPARGRKDVIEAVATAVGHPTQLGNTSFLPSQEISHQEAIGARTRCSQAAQKVSSETPRRLDTAEQKTSREVAMACPPVRDALYFCQRGHFQKHRREKHSKTMKR